MAADSSPTEALIDIAVLDDDLDFRNYMEDVLKDEGSYTVRTFAHPDDLFAAARNMSRLDQCAAMSMPPTMGPTMAPMRPTPSAAPTPVERTYVG